MQKNEFEKQVQQKMEELKLDPSGTVWSKIEARISKRKSRRFGFIFFVTILMGFLCGGYWLLNSTNNLNNNNGNKVSKNLITSKNSPDTQHILLKRKTIKESFSPATLNNISSAKNGVVLNRKKIKFTQLPAEVQHNKRVLKKIKSQNASLKNLRNNFPGKLQINSNKIDIGVVENENVKTTGGANLQESNKIITQPGIETGHKENISDTSVNNFTADSINKLSDSKNVTPGSVKAKLLNLDIPKSFWNWGITFSTGVSGVPNKFLGSLDKSFVADFSSAPSAGGTPLPGGNQLPQLPSKINFSKALIAGFFAEKNISKNAMFTIGLNYKMFSSMNKVGKKSDSVQTYRVSNAGNNYHNYYHFIELPVSIKIQIITKEIPVFWDAGISLSKLISSNALQFNYNSEIYYHDNSLFHKSQTGFNTGFSISLFNKQKTSILIGPCIYYGITKVAQQGLYKNQHFTFIGFRSQFLFKK